MMALLFVFVAGLAGASLTGWLAGLGGLNSRGWRAGAGGVSGFGISSLMSSFGTMTNHFELAAAGEMGVTGVLMFLALLLMIAVWVFNLVTSGGEEMIR